MKFFHAKTQRCKERLVFYFAPLRFGVEKLVAIAVALSFFAILVPISSASSDKAMPCCVGKAAGHCDSGIPAIKTPPSEPMCGLDNSDIENDDITIVAKPSSHESHHSLSQTAETTSRAAESTSVSKPCQMECGACTASASVPGASGTEASSGSAPRLQGRRSYPTSRSRRPDDTASL